MAEVSHIMVKVSVDTKEAIESLKELERCAISLYKEIEALEKAKKQTAGYVNIDDLKKAAEVPITEKRMSEYSREYAKRLSITYQACQAQRG